MPNQGENGSTVACRVVDLHLRVATSRDPSVSAPDSAVYRASRALMLDSVQLAFPGIDPDVLYAKYASTGESVLDCVRELRRPPVQLDADRAWDDTGAWPFV